MHVPDALRDDSSRDFFFKYSKCPLVRGAVWSLQQYTFWLLKSQIRSWKYLNGSLLEFLESLSIFSSCFLLQVHCLNDEHWQFSYCAAINIPRQISQVNMCVSIKLFFLAKNCAFFSYDKKWDVFEFDYLKIYFTSNWLNRSGWLNFRFMTTSLCGLVTYQTSSDTNKTFTIIVINAAEMEEKLDQVTHSWHPNHQNFVYFFSTPQNQF